MLLYIMCIDKAKKHIYYNVTSLFEAAEARLNIRGQGLTELCVWQVLPASPRISLASSFAAFEKALNDMALHEQDAKFAREQRMRTAASERLRRGRHVQR